MGDDSERPHVVIVNSSQGVTSFVGAVYTLKMVTLPVSGVGQYVTSPSTFDVALGSWGQVSTPYSGNPNAMTWSWVGVKGGASVRVALIFGVGDAEFPTPTPVPQPRFYSLMAQPGNATFAFNLRYLSGPTTTDDEGWGGLMRVNGQWSEAFFSSGVARLVDLNATVRFDRLADSVVRLVFTVNNPRVTPVDIDLLFSCATTASSVTVSQQAVLHFDGGWDMTIIRRALDGAPVDTLERFSPFADSWETTGAFNGRADGVSFSWIGHTVPAKSALELATIFAIGGVPNFPSPMATASQPARATRSRTPTRTSSRTNAPAVPEATAPGTVGASALKALPGGAITGIVIGITAILVFVMTVVCCVVRKGRRKGDEGIGDELATTEPAFKGLYV
jgi:hypothetical protein